MTDFSVLRSQKSCPRTDSCPPEQQDRATRPKDVLHDKDHAKHPENTLKFNHTPIIKGFFK